MKKIFWNAAEGRLRAFWRLVLYLFAIALLFELISIGTQVVARALGGFHGNLPLFRLTNGLIILFAMFGAAVLSALLFDRRSVADLGFHFGRHWWADLAFGLVLGAALMAIVFLVENAAGWLQVSGTRVNNHPEWSFNLWAIANAGFYLCVGIYEELFSRGYLLRNLAEGLRIGRIRPRTALVIAYLISSSIFGVLHLGNPNASMISTLNLILAGLFLGLGYVLTGDLAISIGLHITWNFFQGVVFGFPVSGGAPIASYIGIRQLGPDWITGGAFGPEAGIMGLAAMALGSVVILLWVRRTRGKLALHERLAVFTSGPTQSKLLTQAQPTTPLE